MVIQMCFLFKRPPTSWASMWPVLGMTFHMSGKVAATNERFVAQRTHIRAFPCMNYQMGSQALFPFKNFATNIALVWCLVWMSCHGLQHTTITNNNSNHFETDHMCWPLLAICIYQERPNVNPLIVLTPINFKKQRITIVWFHCKLDTHRKSYLIQCHI